MKTSRNDTKTARGWKRMLIIKRRRRLQMGVKEEFPKANQLLSEIFSRLSMREMTEDEVYYIMGKLQSLSFEGLQATMYCILNGEKEVRKQLFRRICQEKELSQEEKEETKTFLESLNLSELEVVEGLIFNNL